MILYLATFTILIYFHCTSPPCASMVVGHISDHLALFSYVILNSFDNTHKIFYLLDI